MMRPVRELMRQRWQPRSRRSRLPSHFDEPTSSTLWRPARHRNEVGPVTGSGGRLRTVPAETHVNQGPIGRDTILEIVRNALADILEIDPATISEGQSFVDDLEADSLALIELVESLEEELSDRTVGFRIEDEDLEDLKTVRDAVDYVHTRVG